jgi:hypothetical protein
MSKGHDYKLQYDVDMKAGHYTAEELKASGKGGTDGLIIISCIEPEDGSYSQNHFSKDGATDKSMTTAQEQKAWLMMGMALLRRTDLRPDFRAAIEAARDAVFGDKS